MHPNTKRSGITVNDVIKIIIVICIIIFVDWRGVKEKILTEPIDDTSLIVVPERSCELHAAERMPDREIQLGSPDGTRTFAMSGGATTESIYVSGTVKNISDMPLKLTVKVNYVVNNKPASKKYNVELVPGLLNPGTTGVFSFHDNKIVDIPEWAECKIHFYREGKKDSIGSVVTRFKKVSG